MNYNIFNQSGELINTIVATETFCQFYCDANGYTYSAVDPDPPPEPEPEPTEVEQLRAQVADLQNQILTMRLGG